MPGGRTGVDEVLSWGGAALRGLSVAVPITREIVVT